MRTRRRRSNPFVDFWKFRLGWDKPEIRKGESGTEYRTLDERCAACVIQDGDEPPCMPPHFLALEEERGYPCPRREPTSPDDGITMTLASLGARQESAHLFRELLAAHEFTPAERRSILRRILRAYSDEGISAHLWPKPPER